MATTAAPAAPSTLRGGEWLLQPSTGDSTFTPEKRSDEHRLIARTAQEFVQNEILPVLDKLAKGRLGDVGQFQSALNELRPELDYDGIFARTIKGLSLIHI